MYKLDLEGGKYSIVLSDDYSKFTALRYGKEWRNLTGDNLVLALVHKVQELENKLNKIPVCFLPEDNTAYPLCVGREYTNCDYCNLYVNMKGEGG